MEIILLLLECQVLRRRYCPKKPWYVIVKVLHFISMQRTACARSEPLCPSLSSVLTLLLCDATLQVREPRQTDTCLHSQEIAFTKWQYDHCCLRLQSLPQMRQWLICISQVDCSFRHHRDANRPVRLRYDNAPEIYSAAACLRHCSIFVDLLLVVFAYSSVAIEAGTRSKGEEWFRIWQSTTLTGTAANASLLSEIRICFRRYRCIRFATARIAKSLRRFCCRGCVAGGPSSFVYKQRRSGTAAGIYLRSRQRATCRSASEGT